VIVPVFLMDGAVDAGLRRNFANVEILIQDFRYGHGSPVS